MIVRPGKIQLELSGVEVRCLLSLMFQYNTYWIDNRNERIMVMDLLGKLIVKLSQLNGDSHKISISAATAAAFDLAFRCTPIPLFNTEFPFISNEMEENTVMRVLDAINRVLI